MLGFTGVEHAPPLLVIRAVLTEATLLVFSLTPFLVTGAFDTTFDFPFWSVRAFRDEAALDVSALLELESESSSAPGPILSAPPLLMRLIVLLTALYTMQRCIDVRYCGKLTSLIENIDY